MHYSSKFPLRDLLAWYFWVDSFGDNFIDSNFCWNWPLPGPAIQGWVNIVKQLEWLCWLFEVRPKFSDADCKSIRSLLSANAYKRCKTPYFFCSAGNANEDSIGVGKRSIVLAVILACRYKCCYNWYSYDRSMIWLVFSMNIEKMKILRAPLMQAPSFVPFNYVQPL